MCLTIPLQVKAVEGNTARLSDGRRVNVGGIIGELKNNDWVLANADLAVSKISEEEAKEIINYFK